MKSLIALLFVLVLFVLTPSSAQVVTNYVGDESFMYAETKQINQFFRRFNSEEDLTGKRLAMNDSMRHNPVSRRSYIQRLFNEENTLAKASEKEQFIKEVTTPENQELLDFYSRDWFAEVKANFYYKGSLETVVLFLELEQENLGHKWAITNVYFEPFTELFYSDSTASAKFLHPMSHELDFMNLIKVFQDFENVEYYFEHDYKPDFTTLFIYETKKKNLVFESVESVNFHFFQIDNWYFELSEYNRNTGNSGWLISNLMKLAEDQKDILLKYIYYEK